MSIAIANPLASSQPDAVSLVPWMGVLVGCVLAGAGIYLLLNRITGLAAEHSHPSAGSHSHVHAPPSLLARLLAATPLTHRWLALAAPACMTILGAALAIQSFLAARVGAVELPKDGLGPLFFVIGLGLILGMRHSTDADHVVAISTIVSRQRSIRNAALIGSIWGLGHTITIFLVGSLIILFGVEIPPRVGLAMEFSVAVMLVLLGILNLAGVMQKLAAWLTPATLAKTDIANGGERPSSWSDRLLDSSVGRLGLFQCLRPLVIGLVHGLAGSAAVALLVLSTIHNPMWATAYLLIFGIGTMIGMMCMTAAIALPLAFAGDRFINLGRYLGMLSGAVSLCFGGFLIYQLGYLGGLFTSHPEWTPR